MRRIDPETDVLIAPGEIRELLGRLTERGTEATPAHQARTLEGLAVETGIPVTRLRKALDEVRGRRSLSIPASAWVAFALMACLGFWTLGKTAPVSPPPPHEAPEAPLPQADLSGTVPAASVCYGPGAGDIQVDPSFEPSHPLPPGLSITAFTGGLLWGNGDHRSMVASPTLSDEQAEAIRADVVELLRYVRKAAARRSLPLHGKDDPNQSDRRTVDLSCSMYYGESYLRIRVPSAGAEKDTVAESIIESSAKTLLDQVKAHFRWRRESKREAGP